jgi:hypothetical protein
MTLTHVPIPLVDDGDTIAADSTLIIHRRRRRRWWPWALAATLGLVIGAVGVKEMSGPALSFYGTPQVWRTGAGDQAAMRRIDNALGTEVTVAFERNGVFSAEVPLVNHGRYPVKITGLPERGAFYYGLEGAEMASEPSGPWAPFHSFTLRRGASRWLLLHFRFADCDLEHGEAPAASRTSLPMDYKVFGLHRRQSVPFPRFALSVPSGRCDRPVL